jgi:3-deoxy-D-manno-octulosonic-acid transferase
MESISLFFYNIFLVVYKVAAKLLSFKNKKAKNWVEGQKMWLKQIEKIPTNKQVVWMHCASLGEFEQGRPVLELFKQQHPEYYAVLSFFSPSGYNVAKNYTGADCITYLPLDGKQAATLFLAKVHPNLVLWVKYEYWYYFLKAINAKNIPLFLVSGIFRGNQPFFKWYGAMWRKILGFFTHFFVQNQASANLLAVQKVKNCTVTGDTRFDRVAQILNQNIALPLIEKFCGSSCTIVAGSTWLEDDEELCHYANQSTQIKFVIAPHEVDTENIKEVQALYKNAILFSVYKNNQDTAANILIIDNVGMLSKLYYYADIAYVGGGFGNDGVHNVLEPAVFGIPILFGPEYEKFVEAVDLVETGGAISVENALELEQQLNNFVANNDLRNEIGALAAKYVQAKTGASTQIVTHISKWCNGQK